MYQPGSAGATPAQIAEWAGHGVAVLLRIYTKCFDGQDKLNKCLIQDILRERSDKHEE